MDGAKIPRNKTGRRKPARGRAATAVKHGHVMAKVIKKNSRSARVCVFSTAAIHQGYDEDACGLSRYVIRVRSRGKR
jgi:hypothetical protein